MINEGSSYRYPEDSSGEDAESSPPIGCPVLQSGLRRLGVRLRSFVRSGREFDPCPALRAESRSVWRGWELVG